MKKSSDWYLAPPLGRNPQRPVQELGPLTAWTPSIVGSDSRARVDLAQRHEIRPFRTLTSETRGRVPLNVVQLNEHRASSRNINLGDCSSSNVSPPSFEHHLSSVPQSYLREYSSISEYFNFNQHSSIIQIQSTIIDWNPACPAIQPSAYSSWSPPHHIISTISMLELESSS